jgi:hypothetical protein
MNVGGTRLYGEENKMCLNCGNCSKEHQSNIDDAMDAVLDSSVL